jgi:hypothetical protein
MANTRKLLLQAAMAHHESKRADALANLDVYLGSSVGVGDHPTLTEEVRKLIETITNSDDNIETIKKYFHVDMD